jgi:hypothetical protein
MKLNLNSIAKGASEEEKIEQTADEGIIGSNMKKVSDNDIQITLHSLYIILAMIGLMVIYAIYGLIQYNSGEIMDAQVCELSSSNKVYAAKVYSADDSKYYTMQISQSDYNKLYKGANIKIHITNGNIERVTSRQKYPYIIILVLSPIAALLAIAKEGSTGKSRNSIKFNDTNDLL